MIVADVSIVSRRPVDGLTVTSVLTGGGEEVGTERNLVGEL